jgi:outer membrane protein TolC
MTRTLQHCHVPVSHLWEGVLHDHAMLFKAHDVRTALWLLLATGQAAFGQTLAQAVDAAWARSPQAVALTARQAEVQARAVLTREWTPGPAAVSISQLNDRLNRDQGRQEWEVEVSTPLWLPGQKAARQKEAADLASDVQARGAALRLQLAGDVREAWWALALAREVAALARQRLEASSALAQLVQRRYKVGELARLDANLAQAEQLSAQGEVLEADSSVRQAQQVFESLVGAPPPAQLAPEAPRAMATDEAPPQLQALQSAVSLAQSRLALADATRREAPQLALRWNNQRGDATTPYSQGIGVKLTVPFSSGTLVRQEGAAARAELAQAEADLALALARMRLEVSKAQGEFDMAQRQLAMAEERRALTADNLRLAQRSFELGESDLSALMRARAAAHESQAWFKRQEVARAAALSRIYQSHGVLP